MCTDTCSLRHSILLASLMHLGGVAILIVLAMVGPSQDTAMPPQAESDNILMLFASPAQVTESVVATQAVAEAIAVAETPPVRSEVIIAKEIVSRPSPASVPVQGKEFKEVVHAAHEYARPQHDLNPVPDYPIMLRQRGIEGTVWLRVFVDRSGLPERIILFKTSGYRLFDESALRAVARWRFKPARSQGATMASWVEFPVRFTLQG
jgi:periplasmic protein TonB